MLPKGDIKMTLTRQPKYISKVSLWGHDVSFLLIFFLNIALVLLILILWPSIFAPEIHVNDANIPRSMVWKTYITLEVATFLISFCVALVTFCFFNIKKAKGQGLINLLCLFAALLVVEFVYMGLFVSPHKCPEELIPPACPQFQRDLSDIPHFGYYGPGEKCVRIINHIFTVFLFLPLIYGISKVAHRNKRTAIILKRSLMVFVGIMFFAVLKQIALMWLIKTLFPPC